MKKQGYSEPSLKFTSKALKFLNSKTNINDPEAVKEFIACYDSASSYKRNLCYAYSHYLKFAGLSWVKPKYYTSNKLPKIPSEQKLDMIISASSQVLALRLCISKESFAGRIRTNFF